MANGTPRIAIIGCGAITELGHLPAAAGLKDAKIEFLVDANKSRAETLARKFHVPNICEKPAEIVGKADAAIVALPPHLHSSVSIELLRRGVHVLVEKPMALTTAQCDEMIQAAQQGHAVLAVGHMRRFQHSASFTKSAIENGMLGEIESFDVRDGLVYSWPAASDYPFRKELAGGGVLFDYGVHAIDSLLWWLGDAASFEYCDDNFGGVEADCEIRFAMKNGARGIIEVSRTRNLRNTAIITGRKASLEVALQGSKVRLRTGGRVEEIAGEVQPDASARTGEPSYLASFTAQMQDWVNAIRNGATPLVSGSEGRRCVAQVEACYAQRKPLNLPWLKPAAEEAR